MAVLALRFSWPLQSWGDCSRFNRRLTRREPTKSGVVGLLAASLGRDREDSVEDLARLELAVRVDQRGTLIRDFQTEILANGKALPLSHRYYLGDAKFMVALAGSESLLESLRDHLLAPVWPLYLGRRSCPPDQPLVYDLDFNSDDPRAYLESVPWQASERYRREHRGEDLEIVCDGRDGEICESRADYPLSFSSKGRLYACRPVARLRVRNPDMVSGASGNIAHDPMAYL